ncbi:MAG: hypothetical protein WC371_05790 [Parachlamydiales bacterium]|jgi:predicted DNA-binding protein
MTHGIGGPEDMSRIQQKIKELKASRTPADSVIARLAEERLNEIRQLQEKQAGSVKDRAKALDTIRGRSSSVLSVDSESTEKAPSLDLPRALPNPITALQDGLGRLKRTATKEQIISTIKEVTDQVFGAKLKEALAASTRDAPLQTPRILALIKEILPLVLRNYVQRQVMMGKPITADGLKSALTEEGFIKVLMSSGYSFSKATAVEFSQKYLEMIKQTLAL